MVLHTRGRVGSRRFSAREPLESTPEAFFIYMAVCSPTGEWASGAGEGRLNVFPCPSEGSEFPLATEQVGSRRFLAKPLHRKMWGLSSYMEAVSSYME
ncbi:MAG: hypothetical protein J6T78_07520 [Bacteroidaceae bacterium]|nr:hypothetical protein [Bacteroidaceae bacterium]